MQEPPLVSFSIVSRVFERPVAAAPNCSEVNAPESNSSSPLDREPVDLVGHVGARQADVVQAEIAVAELAGSESASARSRPSSSCTLMSGRPLLFMSTRPTWLPPMPETTQVSLPPESRSAREV